MQKTILLIIIVLLANYAQAQESLSDIPQLHQAQLLIESNKSREAYELLQPLELTQAGNIQYDYLLGISALNSGKASQAVFALERAQMTDSKYRDVGLWLAIAYYRSGDMDRAIPGFNSVVTTSKSSESKATANRYLATIKHPKASPNASKRDANQISLLGKVEAGTGYDSNIANFPSSSSQLTNTLAAPTSNLGGLESILNFGIEGRIPIEGNYAFVSVDDGRRMYRDHGIMNSETIITKVGMNFTSSLGNAYRVNLSKRIFNQEGSIETSKDLENDYVINGLEGSSKLKLSEYDHLGFVAQYNEFHMRTFNLEDTHQVVLGANYMHVIQVSGAPVIYIGYMHIADNASNMKPAYNPTYNNGLTVASRVTSNYTLYFQYSIANSIDIFSTDYINFRRDTGAFARDSVVAFGKDRTKYFSIGLNWRPWPLWTVAPQVAITSNDSNIPLYTYDKTETLITLKREFNSL